MEEEHLAEAGQVSQECLGRSERESAAIMDCDAAGRHPLKQDSVSWGNARDRGITPTGWDHSAIAVELRGRQAIQTLQHLGANGPWEVSTGAPVPDTCAATRGWG